MTWMLAARVRLLVNRLNPNQPHQALYPLAVYVISLTTQLRHHSPRTIKGPLDVYLVDAAHQLQLFIAHGLWFVIQRRAADTKQLTLPGN